MPQPADPSDLPMSDTQPAGTPVAEVACVDAGLHWRVARLLQQHADGDPTEELETTLLEMVRSEWAAALRWESDQLRAGKMAQDYAASCVYLDAHRVETGALTPWTGTPEPSTPPAQPHADSRAAAGGHPGTLDRPGVIGRALLHQTTDGHPQLWAERDGLWHTHIASVPRTRGYVERVETSGPVREVLLVDPAARECREQLADAARRVAGLDSLGDFVDWRHVAALHRRLRAAVDAYDRPTTGAPPPAEVRCHCGERIIHATADGYGEDGCDDPAPQAAGDMEARERHAAADALAGHAQQLRREAAQPDSINRFKAGLLRAAVLAERRTEEVRSGARTIPEVKR